MSEWKSGSNFDAFHSLETEKQTRIVNAALVEFAAKGFKGASTNAIAKNAQIGKGMLFYYFGSKEELFEFLCQYTIEFAKNNYINSFECTSGDFIERCKALSDLKQRTMSKFPEVINFLEGFYREENEPYFAKFSLEIGELKQRVNGKIYEGVDYSLFREDMDGKNVVKYIKWLLNAYELETIERFKRKDFDIDNPQSLAAEWSRFYAFVEDLRKSYYKEYTSNENH